LQGTGRGVKLNAWEEGNVNLKRRRKQVEGKGARRGEPGWGRKRPTTENSIADLSVERDVLKATDTAQTRQVPIRKP